MKKILLSFFAFGIINSFAQITLTQSDVASIGDTIRIARDTMPSGITVGGTGMQSWDFSSMQMHVLNDNIFLDPATTPAGSSFPSSNLAIDMNGLLNYATVDANEFNINGIYGDPFGFGQMVTVDFNPPQKMMEFPSTLNNSFTSHMRLDYKFAINPPQFGIDSAEIVRNSYDIRTIDAYGQVITPADTFDCLRQFSHDTIIDTIYVHSSGAWNIMPELFLAFLPPELGYTHNPDTSVNFTYSWYANGEGMAVAEVTTDAPAGNTLSASFKITDKVVAGLFTVTNASCSGGTDGSATVTAISGYSPYTYVWNDGQTGATATGLSSGTYTVTVTDNIGNTNSSSVTVSEPSAISTDSITVTDATCDTCANGSATVWANGGTSPYTYNWSNGQISASLVNVQEGMYYVTITDGNNCSVTDSVVVGFWATGIEEKSAISTFMIYPNPNYGKFTVISRQSLVISQIKIYNVLGEVVYAIKLSTNNEQLTTNLPSGIYFVKIESDGFIETRKINVIK